MGNSNFEMLENRDYDEKDAEREQALKDWAYKLDSTKGEIPCKEISDALHLWTSRRMADAKENQSFAEEDMNRLQCYEHDGWKPLKITEADLQEIFKGHNAGYETAPTLVKQVSIDMSYYNWNPPVVSDEDGEETGVRCSSPLVYGENNPIYGMEIYVPNRPGVDMSLIRQLIGNLGGYANAEYFEDTNVVMLGDSTLQKLEQGIKDDVIIGIESQYNKSNTRMFNIQFTSERDFIHWLKARMEKFPDKSTMKLLDKYKKE